MRLYGGILILIVFIGWVLYRGLIKRDLKKHMELFYMGTFFIGVWAIIYSLMLF